MAYGTANLSGSKQVEHENPVMMSDAPKVSLEIHLRQTLNCNIRVEKVQVIPSEVHEITVFSL